MNIYTLSCNVLRNNISNFWKWMNFDFSSSYVKFPLQHNWIYHTLNVEHRTWIFKISYFIFKRLSANRRVGFGIIISLIYSHFSKIITIIILFKWFKGRNKYFLDCKICTIDILSVFSDTFILNSFLIRIFISKYGKKHTQYLQREIKRKRTKQNLFERYLRTLFILLYFLYNILYYFVFLFCFLFAEKKINWKIMKYKFSSKFNFSLKYYEKKKLYAKQFCFCVIWAVLNEVKK